MKSVFAVTSRKTDDDRTFSKWLILVLLAVMYLSHGQEVTDTSPAEDSTLPDGSATVPTVALETDPASVTDATMVTGPPISNSPITDGTAGTSGR